MPENNEVAVLGLESSMGKEDTNQGVEQKQQQSNEIKQNEELTKQVNDDEGVIDVIHGDGSRDSFWINFQELTRTIPFRNKWKVKGFGSLPSLSITIQKHNHNMTMTYLT